MRILIEALGIHYYGGGRTATLNLLEALFAIDRRNEYMVVLSQPEPSLVTPAGNVRQTVIPLRNRLALRLCAQLFLPFKARRYDLVHFVKNLGVFGLSTPSIVTVYDMTTLIHPELFPTLDVWYWRYIEKHTLRRASRVIAISRNTARDIERFYRVPHQNIRVVYPSVASHFRPAQEEKIARVRERYGLPPDYFVHIGRIDRKKNLPMLVEAFKLFRERTTYAGKLVFVGEVYRKSEDPSLLPTIQRCGLQQHVLFTGPVPDADIAALYSGATLAVFPSLHEGFGLVALEAMSCGTPLIASPAGAVAEVVGDAALLLDTQEPAALANLMGEIAEDPQLRGKMKQQGLARAASFCREDSARQTLQVYRETLSQEGTSSLRGEAEK
jgi:glycosyltransferase involved in cell wall biosynthesis